MNNHRLNIIGIWSLRILLAAGAIVAACMGRDNAAESCVFGLVMSFFLLSTEEEE